MNEEGVRLLKNALKNSNYFIDKIELIEKKKITTKNFTENSNRYYRKLTDIYYSYLKSIDELVYYCERLILEERYYEKLVNNQVKKISYNTKEIINSIFKKMSNNWEVSASYCTTLKQELEENKISIKVLGNMIYSFIGYVYNINYKQFKKINYYDLTIGDIVLTVRNKKSVNNNFIYKLINLVSNSYISHAAIYYGKEKGKYYLIDTPDTFRMLNNHKNDFFQKIEGNYHKGAIGLVIRKKKGLKGDQKNQIKDYLDSTIGRKYNGLKVFSALVEAYIFKKLPFYNKLRNPIRSSNSVFCSEHIVNAYNSANIILANEADESMISPSDLLNNKDFGILGYIEDENKKN